MKKWFRENYLKVGDNFETLPTFLTENDIQNFEKKTEPEPVAEKPKKPRKTPSKPKAKKPAAKPKKKDKKK
jgi:hypothetical protein